MYWSIDPENDRAQLVHEKVILGAIGKPPNILYIFYSHYQCCRVVAVDIISAVRVDYTKGA